jgi:hypothetical protein
MIKGINIAAVFMLALSGTAVAQTSGQVSTQAGANAGVQATVAEAQASTNASATASAKASGQTANQQSLLATGTAINAELNQSLDSKKAKVGDEVVARTTDNIKADGKTVLPKGSKLIGHVTRATARTKGDADSALAIQFDHAVLKNGQTMPVTMSIQALAAEQSAAAIGSDDLEAIGNAGAGASSGGRGAGVAGTAGSATSGVGGTASRATQGATGAVGSTANGAAGVATRGMTGATGGLNPAGRLTTSSRGVFGLNGLSLDANAANSAQGSVITSSGKQVRLDSGTRMLLVVQAESSASAQR